MRGERGRRNTGTEGKGKGKRGSGQRDWPADYLVVVIDCNVSWSLARVGAPPSALNPHLARERKGI